MEENLQIMLKKVSISYSVIGIVLFTVLSLYFPKYLLPTMCGLIIAMLSFYCNAMVTNYSLNKDNGKKSVVMLSIVIRLLIIGLAGWKLYNYNEYYLLAYMFGYSAHFIAIILYGLTLNYAEGK